MSPSSQMDQLLIKEADASFRFPMFAPSAAPRGSWQQEQIELCESGYSMVPSSVSVS